MKLIKGIYYCSNCKAIFKSHNDLLFVEDGSSRGFCSEKCIESYYAPLVEYYQGIELAIRKEYGVEKEDCDQFVNNAHYLEMALQHPNEVWRLQNELKEEVFAFIANVDDEQGRPFYIVILCLVFDQRPSFIFSVVTTRNLDVVKEYQVGVMEEDISKFRRPSAAVSTELDREVLALLENKKSVLLATLLEERSKHDIAYEQFYLYDEFYPKTLEAPDEIYEMLDEVGDKLYIYIKAHERQGISFYYFVICMHMSSNWQQSSEMLLPILSFPSIDGKLYKLYRQKGELLAGAIKN